MFLKSLNLTNFRNYSKLSYQFEHPITVVVGDNAKGKSNFLESIFFLATTRSERTQQDEEFIKIGKEMLRVEGEIVQNSKERVNLEVILQSHNFETHKVSKKVKINGIPKRVSDYTSNFVAIFFSPEDINLVTGPPSLRRHHINLILSQVDKNYKKALSAYEKVIIRKNKILKNIKEGLAKLAELDYWKEQQLIFGKIVSKKRKEFFDYINGFNKDNNFLFEYIENILNTERLKEYLEREIQASLSLIGPHRDDFTFFLQEKNLSKFGSRGEQRTATLYLKLLEINFTEKIINARPILLLDDIFSELDWDHRQLVIDIAKKQQTIITAIELDNNIIRELGDAKILKIESVF